MATFTDKEALQPMIQRCKTLAASGLLLTGLAIAFAGCSESTPAPPPEPVSVEPEKPLTAAEKRAREREFADMGIREKREWRRQQGEEAGQTP